MKISSTAVTNGVLSPLYGSASPIADDRSKEGLVRRSFPVSWEDEPEGTVSFCLLMIDYDNVEDEGVPWIHWIAADIPSYVHALNDDESRQNSDMIQGFNSFMLPYDFYLDIDEEYHLGYVGPAPERPHTYELTIYALDTYLDFSSGFFYSQMRNEMENHVLDQQTLKLKYYPEQS